MKQTEINPQSGKRRLVTIILIIIVVLSGIWIGLTMSQNNKKMEKGDQTEITSEEKDYILIETPYIDLKFPAENSADILYEQEIQGTLTTEVFYMLNGEAQIPIFRIDFGDPNAGDWLGVLKTEEGEIPVTYTVFLVGDEEMSEGGTTDEVYSALMEGFNEMLEELYKDERFEKEMEASDVENQEAKLKYWTLNLPGNMSWSEDTVDGNYQVIFYGEVQGERVALYMVRIGDVEAKTVLGQYELEGVERTVSVESYELEQYVNWSEEDFSTAYNMMDTINVVISEITSSKEFSELIDDETLGVEQIGN